MLIEKLQQRLGAEILGAENARGEETISIGREHAYDTFRALSFLRFYNAVVPMVIARLAQLTAAAAGERALVVAAGTGYGAALLAALYWRA